MPGETTPCLVRPRHAWWAHAMPGGPTMAHAPLMNSLHTHGLGEKVEVADKQHCIFSPMYPSFPSFYGDEPDTTCMHAEALRGNPILVDPIIINQKTGNQTFFWTSSMFNSVKKCGYLSLCYHKYV